MNSRKKLCIVATVPMVLHVFMGAHIKALSENYDITLLSPGTREDVAALLSDRVKFVSFSIERKISIVEDLRSLFVLWRFLSTQRFDCVLSLMPKSGLVAMLAGFFSRTQSRIHFFTGQVWATKQGLGRKLLMFLDRLLAAAATHLLTDSNSQRAFLIESAITSAEKIQVLGKGSICGVDVQRFQPDEHTRKELREQMGIAQSSVVFLFLGRVNRAKGVLDLGQAFSSLGAGYEDAHLVVVGPDDEGIDPELAALLASRPGRFHRVGFTSTPERYMAMADVFCMPSYREGFGSAVIEAAAVGLPSMVSRIYGLTDAVEEEVTGVFHEPGDVEDIHRALGRLYSDSELRDRLGNSALNRARRDFSQEEVVGEMQVFIRSVV
ncbi:glycosyltransferase [Pseudomonas wadenswilerensis]|uniref:glycosyltransferase n=1 Tax=Pseudomonas wadenswilerensis TaxID=1785161 RepID=UPI003207D528